MEISYLEVKYINELYGALKKRGIALKLVCECEKQGAIQIDEKGLVCPECEKRWVRDANWSSYEKTVMELQTEEAKAIEELRKLVHNAQVKFIGAMNKDKDVESKIIAILEDLIGSPDDYDLKKVAQDIIRIVKWNE